MTVPAADASYDPVAPRGALRARFGALTRDHNFAGGLYVHLGHRTSDVAEMTAPLNIIAAGRADEAQYRKGNYVRIDPLARRAATSFVPFVWTVAELEGDDACRPLMTALRSWGAREGVVVPIQDHASGTAFLSLFRQGRMIADDAARDGALLLAAGRLHAQARAVAMQASALGDALSEREISVLRLAALGHTEVETAQMLALSRRGVQFHLTRAFAKLGAANKTAAVARAVAQGVIAL